MVFNPENHVFELRLASRSGVLNLKFMTTTEITQAPDSFAAMFEESLNRKEMRAGEVITAEVVRVDYNYVVVNAGLKS